jgi:hypothetical protein
VPWFRTGAGEDVALNGGGALSSDAEKEWPSRGVNLFFYFYFLFFLFSSSLSLLFSTEIAAKRVRHISENNICRRPIKLHASVDDFGAVATF